jgi:hypothetical protein
VSRLEVRSTFDQLTRPDHQHLVNVYAGSAHESAVLGRGQERASFATGRPIWTSRNALLVAAAVVLLAGRAAFALVQRRRRA